MEGHFAYLEWAGSQEWSLDETTQAFRAAYDKLRSVMGGASYAYAAPPEARPFGYGFVPSITWESPDVILDLTAVFPPHVADPARNPVPAPDFATACFSVTVRHEPSGYETLKAEARAIKERKGHGNRLDTVVW